MRPCLQLVTQQFPNLRERVACLFDRDHIFRELCEDYETCILALAEELRSEGLRREYAALRLRLETELLRYVGEAGQVVPDED
jgi:hypothetical protein